MPIVVSAEVRQAATWLCPGRSAARALVSAFTRVLTRYARVVHCRPGIVPVRGGPGSAAHHSRTLVRSLGRAFAMRSRGTASGTHRCVPARDASVSAQE